MSDVMNSPLSEALVQAKEAWALNTNLTPRTRASYVNEAEVLVKIWTDAQNVKPLLERLQSLSNSTARTNWFRWRAFKPYLPEEFQKALEKIQTPKLRKKIPKHLTDAQDDHIFRCCKNDQERMILYLGAKMGLRLSEIIQVKYEDFTKNGDDFWLFVLRKGLNEQQLRCPKKMHPTLKRITDNLQKSGLIFPFTTRYLQRLVEQIGRRAKLPFKLSPHVLRHTFATQMAMHGADLLILQNLMGHESISTTMRYIHFTEDRRERANRIMDKI